MCVQNCFVTDPTVWFVSWSDTHKQTSFAIPNKILCQFIIWNTNYFHKILFYNNRKTSLLKKKTQQFFLLHPESWDRNPQQKPILKCAYFAIRIINREQLLAKPGADQRWLFVCTSRSLVSIGCLVCGLIKAVNWGEEGRQVLPSNASHHQLTLKYTLHNRRNWSSIDRL